MPFAGIDRRGLDGTARLCLPLRIMVPAPRGAVVVVAGALSGEKPPPLAGCSDHYGEHFYNEIVQVIHRISIASSDEAAQPLGSAAPKLRRSERIVSLGKRSLRAARCQHLRKSGCPTTFYPAHHVLR